ncbi:MAG: hypothetical protein ACLQMH_15750 [Solirubrobacteraceae bacterium]
MKPRRRRRERRADDGPQYTDKEIQALGELDPPKAFKKKNGEYAWPLVDGRDITNAVKAWNAGRGNPSEREAVRRWIIKRAVRLRVTYRLPDSWAKSVAHVEE